MSSIVQLTILAIFIAVDVFAIKILYEFGKEKGREEVRKEILNSVFELISEIDDGK